MPTNLIDRITSLVESGEASRSGLARAAGFLRGEAGRRLGLRHAPRLDFVYDESIGRADRLTRLIDDAVRNDRADGGDDPRDSGRDP